MVRYKKTNIWYNLSCPLQTYCHFSNTEKLFVSWQFFETYGIINYGSGWRRDVVNQCLEFESNTASTGVTEKFSQHSTLFTWSTFAFIQDMVIICIYSTHGHHLHLFKGAAVSHWFCQLPFPKTNFPFYFTISSPNWSYKLQPDGNPNSAAASHVIIIIIIFIIIKTQKNVLTIIIFLFLMLLVTLTSWKSLAA